MVNEKQEINRYKMTELCGDFYGERSQKTYNTDIHWGGNYCSGNNTCLNTVSAYKLQVN